MLYVPSFMSQSGSSGNHYRRYSHSSENLHLMLLPSPQHNVASPEHDRFNTGSPRRLLSTDVTQPLLYGYQPYRVGNKLVRFSNSNDVEALSVDETMSASAQWSQFNSPLKSVNLQQQHHRRRRKNNPENDKQEQLRLDLRKSNLERAQMDENLWGEVHNCQTAGCQRVTLNVSGMHFETRIGVLDRHPRTLLGNSDKRIDYFDSHRQEYFFDRHRPSFEAIFNYYQYGGKLKRPIHVPDDIFLTELEFYQIEQELVDVYKRDEGYVIDNSTLPENPFKRKIWMLFEYPETSTLAFIIAVFSVLFTIASIILFCVETLPVFRESHCDAGEAPNFLDPFFIIETLCTLWFTFEALIRFLVCPSKSQFVKDVKNAVDIAAIVPYYVTLFNVLLSFSCEGAKSSASLAFLRVIRLIRVFKLTKHSAGLQVLILTFRASVEGLGLFLVTLIVCILVFSSTIYHVEVETEDSQIESIPDAFWWAIITMCTVGYGDKVPISPMGKIVGSICALAGVLTLAIPVPIITENFNKFYAHKTGRGRL